MPSSSVDQEVRESCRTKGQRRARAVTQQKRDIFNTLLAEQEVCLVASTRFFAPIVLHVWPIVIGQIRWPYKLEALYGHRLRLLVQGSRIRLVLGCVISPLRQHAESRNLQGVPQLVSQL